MTSRILRLAVAMGAAVATASCSTVVPDSSPGPTLVPLETLPLPASTPSLSVDDSDAADPAVEGSDADAPPDTEAEPAATSTTILTSTTTSSTSTSTTEPASTTTAPPSGGLVDGVRATIGGRGLSFASSCRDGRAVKLDGVTWAFGGNSFRFSGDDDVRSEAELVGDGWTMPMLVGSVRSGVYTYLGTPVDGSVGSAEVVVDHGALPNC